MFSKIKSLNSNLSCPVSQPDLMSSSLQKSAPPASAVEGQWLRDADSLLLLCPAWEEVKVALSVYVQDFIKDICEKKPSMSQVGTAPLSLSGLSWLHHHDACPSVPSWSVQIMFDVVGHRLMEAVMGDSLQYQPLLLKEVRKYVELSGQSGPPWFNAGAAMTAQTRCAQSLQLGPNG